MDLDNCSKWHELVCYPVEKIRSKICTRRTMVLIRGISIWSKWWQHILLIWSIFQHINSYICKVFDTIIWHLHWTLCHFHQQPGIFSICCLIVIWFFFFHVMNGFYNVCTLIWREVSIYTFFRFIPMFYGLN